MDNEQSIKISQILVDALCISLSKKGLKQDETWILADRIRGILGTSFRGGYDLYHKLREKEESE